jgi:hypothetical protein
MLTPIVTEMARLSAHQSGAPTVVNRDELESSDSGLDAPVNPTAASLRSTPPWRSKE